MSKTSPDYIHDTNYPRTWTLEELAYNTVRRDGDNIEICITLLRAVTGVSRSDADIVIRVAIQQVRADDAISALEVLRTKLSDTTAQYIVNKATVNEMVSLTSLVNDLSDLLRVIEEH